MDNRFEIGTKITGVVKSTCIKLGDVLCVEVNPDFQTEYRFIIPQPELDIIHQPRIEGYFKKTIAFVVKDIDEKNKLVLGSRKKHLENKRDQLIETLENGELIEATVFKVEPFGCYLRCADVPLILRNKDFSTDYTPVMDVLQKGDVISCKLTEISKTKRIFVEPETKYTSEKTENVEFEVGQRVAGIITTVTAFGYFVRISSGLDVLCPIDGFELNKRSKVLIEIKQIRDDGRYRGKILGQYFEDLSVLFNLEDLPD